MKCRTGPKHLGGLWQEKNRINVDPPYQREGGIWSEEKKQLFIDSIVNKFDVPKLYWHDLRSKNEPYLWAVIDGKQRLDAIWSFFQGDFGLAEDFEFLGDPRDVADESIPLKNQKYTDFSEALKEYFKSQTVDVVEVDAADDDEIEDLFSRLNNGEPLNAAEKRNAMNGQMAKLIRDVANHSFFKNKLGFSNRRGSFLEVSAKFIKLEINFTETKNHFCDLKKKQLDQMVRLYKDISESVYQGHISRIHAQLNKLEKIFSNSDPLLAKQSYPQLYYAWIRELEIKYAIKNFNKTIHDFLQNFSAKRIANNLKPEDQRDPVLVEFGRLSMQGTNDMASMDRRANILTRYFLAEHPESILKDSRRSFTDDERYLIWILNGKRCACCQKELESLDDMEADHITAWANGGETSLKNAQCLCGSCNQSKGAA